MNVVVPDSSSDRPACTEDEEHADDLLDVPSGLHFQEAALANCLGDTTHYLSIMTSIKN